MEYVSGIKLKDILLDNGTWWKLFVKHRHLIRISIIINVLKLLVCKTGLLGYHYFICPECRKSIKVPHSCKSRFCSSCGKKATDNWIKTNLNLLPKTTWQHITFTMPKELWDFFWVNLYLMNKTPKIAAHIIKTLAKQKGIIPGIFLANHTFGRDLKRNIHIHLSTTTGGLSSCNDSWQKGTYFYHETLKKMWRYHLIALFREEFKQGLMRCTYCYEEMDFSARQVRMLMATPMILSAQSKMNVIFAIPALWYRLNTKINLEISICFMKLNQKSKTLTLIRSWNGFFNIKKMEMPMLSQKPKRLYHT